MEVTVQSFTRLFPATPIKTPHTESLSIVEAFSTHSTAEALWFYDAVLDQSSSSIAERLKTSLVKTLDIFPQYSGRVSANTATQEGDHTERNGRLKLVWGTEKDLGLGLVIAKAEGRLSDLVPDPEQRRGMKGGWDHSNIPIKSLLPGDAFRPALITFLAQITTFECGGFALAISTSHALMDGGCLALFLQNWAYEHNLIFSSQPPKKGPPMPVFKPQLLDREAAGDIDGEGIDPSIAQQCQNLPQPHREPSLSNGTDHDEPALSKIFHFSGSEVDAIHAGAQIENQPVGRQQALIAYIWRTVNRARGWSADGREMNLGMTFDLRRRLGLPTTFLGSAVIHADAHLPGRDICNGSLNELSIKVKDTLNRYDATSLRALLHVLAYEKDPAKFAGQPGGLPPDRNLIVSIIPRMGFYDAIFEGQVPKFVTPTTILIKGLVMVMDARPSEPGKELKAWTDDGIDVVMTLEAETMEKLASDSAVWTI
ncbi:transferase family-domain-containing protein [Lophiotrema nucula]|uniref:Transferase family-domain-containing protein n=1 Tax=Lophiotrema nucula TaxID=690887 RepID=A0A6A5YH47_9PLEO|nr:transferase family-domain-containing protein [Lophiotrema nucula]